MGRSRALVVAVSIASVVLLLASTLGLDWFHANVTLAGPGGDVLAIDLRSIRTCVQSGACASLSLGALKNAGLYPMAGQVAFWGQLLLAAAIAWQCAVRMRGGAVHDGLARLAYAIGALCFVDAGLAGYVVSPQAQGPSLTAVQRTWAPLVALIGDACGLLAIYLTSTDAVVDDGRGYRRPHVPPLATAKVRPGPPPDAAIVRPLNLPIPELMPFDTPRTPPTPPTIARTATAPFALRGRLKYATAVATVSASGIDARHDDGSTRVVAWRDIVGIVARRMPAVAPYDGVTFVDLVSTAGSTLRVLPWTLLAGDRIDGQGDERARAFVQVVASRCPNAQIDPATRRFLGSHGAAAQLPDESTLAAHDQRLA